MAYEDSVAIEVRQQADGKMVDEEDISYGVRPHEDCTSLNQESLESRPRGTSPEQL